jgi:Cu/Ag efflux protein CusF
VRLRTLTAGLVAGACAASLAWAPDTQAQTQQPKAPAGTQAPAAGSPAPGAMDKTIEGKVKSVDTARKTVTLEDGTTFMVTDAAELKTLEPGTMIKASYEDRAGQKVAKSVEVKK